MLPVRFKPFIGENYFQQNFKILVLGESHYLKGENLESYINGDQRVEDFTRLVVQDFLNYKITRKHHHHWMNTFTKFGNVSNQKRLSNNETVRFWQSCSFYNYVQAPTTGPRKSPKREEFKSSYQAFQETVMETKPNLIFIWGFRLWRNLEKTNSIDLIEIKHDNKKLHFLSLGYDVPIKVLPHPSSSSFNYGLSKEIQDYISLVKRYQETTD